MFFFTVCVFPRRLGSVDLVLWPSVVIGKQAWINCCSDIVLFAWLAFQNNYLTMLGCELNCSNQLMLPSLLLLIVSCVSFGV